MTVSSWKMIDAVMYGMMPSAKMVSLREVAAGEQVDQAERGAGVLVEEVGEHASALMPGVGMCAPRR